MKKTSTYIFIALLAAGFSVSSCVKDPLDDVKNGGWNHERTILDIKFENQAGAADIATIDAANGEINLAINTAAVADFSKIKLTKLQTSYQAKSSVTVGETLDFNNARKTAVITITATTGEVRDYTVMLTDFTETLVGTWAINKLVVYGGTGPEYGGGAVLELQEKSWCWYDDAPPAAEYDNTLTFALTEILDNGNTAGTCVNHAGPDGKYANFLFKGEMNPETGQDIDLKKYYRQIPEGTSTWERNYSNGTITFTDANGRRTTGSFLNAGKVELGNNHSFTVENNAFSFNINGTDDWTYIYSDFDKFAKKARTFFVPVTRK